MLNKLFVVLAVSLLTTTSSFAMTGGNGCGGECATCHTLSETEASTLLSKIGAKVKAVKQSPSRGLFEVMAEKDGKQGVVLVDYGKKNLFQGVVISFDTLKPVSAFSQDIPQPKPLTSIDVSTIPVKNALIMGNPKGSKKMFVFSEPDCPYCRKGHEELKKLVALDPDLVIHILLFPLPMHPAAYDKSRALLEAKSSKLTDKAFAGEAIAKPTKKSSKKSLDDLIAFAKASGVSATPTVVMPDGKIVIGISDALALKKMLDGKSGP
jgi:thiol:disulfide interchange protein DsbC